MKPSPRSDALSAKGIVDDDDDDVLLTHGAQAECEEYQPSQQHQQTLQYAEHQSSPSCRDSVGSSLSTCDPRRSMKSPLPHVKQQRGGGGDLLPLCTFLSQGVRTKESEERAHEDNSGGGEEEEERGRSVQVARAQDNETPVFLSISDKESETFMTNDPSDAEGVSSRRRRKESTSMEGSDTSVAAAGCVRECPDDAVEGNMAARVDPVCLSWDCNAHPHCSRLGLCHDPWQRPQLQRKDGGDADADDTGHHHYHRHQHRHHEKLGRFPLCTHYALRAIAITTGTTSQEEDVPSQTPLPHALNDSSLSAACPHKPDLLHSLHYAHSRCSQPPLPQPQQLLYDTVASVPSLPPALCRPPRHASDIFSFSAVSSTTVDSPISSSDVTRTAAAATSTSTLTTTTAEEVSLEALPSPREPLHLSQASISPRHHYPFQEFASYSPFSPNALGSLRLSRVCPRTQQQRWHINSPNSRDGSRGGDGHQRRQQQNGPQSPLLLLPALHLRQKQQESWTEGTASTSIMCLTSQSQVSQSQCHNLALLDGFLTNVGVPVEATEPEVVVEGVTGGEMDDETVSAILLREEESSSRSATGYIEMFHHVGGGSCDGTTPSSLPRVTTSSMQSSFAMDDDFTSIYGACRDKGSSGSTISSSGVVEPAQQGAPKMMTTARAMMMMMMMPLSPSVKNSENVAATDTAADAFALVDKRIDSCAAGYVASSFSAYWRLERAVEPKHRDGTTSSSSTVATTSAGEVLSSEWLTRNRPRGILGLDDRVRTGDEDIDGWGSEYQTGDVSEEEGMMSLAIACNGGEQRRRRRSLKAAVVARMLSQS